MPTIKAGDIRQVVPPVVLLYTLSLVKDSTSTFVLLQPRDMMMKAGLRSRDNLLATLQLSKNTPQEADACMPRQKLIRVQPARG